MRIRAFLLLLVVAFSLMPFGPSAARDQALRLHGSNTIGQRLAPALLLAWAREQAYDVTALETNVAEEHQWRLARNDEQLSIEVQSHGTGTGLSGLLSGRADVWMASRPVKREELAQAASLGALDSPAQEHVIALDGLAIIVHRDNPLSAISVAQLREIFSGKTRDWSRLGVNAGAIRLYARDDKSGTFDSFKAMVLGDVPLAVGAQRFESTDALAAAVAADPRGMGFVGLSGLAGGKVKALAVSDEGTRALAPTRLNVATEDYVLSRRLFLYTAEKTTPSARALIEFALGPRGQQVVEEIGFVSLDVSAYEMPAQDQVSAEYAELTRDARRLSLNFRFGSGQSWLDTRALRDLNRLADYLHRDTSMSQELILLGFVDGRESHPLVATMLANDRVDFVAHRLIPLGVGASRVRGLGAIAPVASNETELGRARNRRVEVWVRERQPARDLAGSAATRNTGTP